MSICGINAFILHFVKISPWQCVCDWLIILLDGTETNQTGGRRWELQEKTLSSTELVSRLIGIIDQMDLRYSINSPQTVTGPLFTFHNVRLSVNKAELEAVLRLSDRLKSLVPYVTLDRVVVMPDRSDPNLLDVQFFISSLEMNTSSSWLSALN